MARVLVEYQCDPRLALRYVRSFPQRLTSELLAALDELMTFAGNVQANRYTAHADPTPPKGSTYERTFKTKAASHTRRLSERLPVIEGEWYLSEEEAPWGEYVLGHAADQAKIHQGRWKSLERVEREVRKVAPGVVQQHVESIEGPP